MILSGFFAVNKLKAVDLNQQVNAQLTAGANKVWATGPQDPRVVAARIIKSFLVFMASIFLILLMLSAYWYITARGEREKIEKATSTMRRAVIGIIIVASAYSITYFVSKNVQRSVGVKEQMSQTELDRRRETDNCIIFNWFCF